MKSTKQQLEEYSALFERALRGDQDAEKEIDAILRKAGSSYVKQVIAIERMNADLNDPVNQFIQNMPYADLRRLVISRLRIAPIEMSAEDERIPQIRAMDWRNMTDYAIGQKLYCGESLAKQLRLKGGMKRR